MTTDIGIFRELVGSQRQIVTFSQVFTVSWFIKSVGLPIMIGSVARAGNVLRGGYRREILVQHQEEPEEEETELAAT